MDRESHSKWGGDTKIVYTRSLQNIGRSIADDTSQLRWAQLHVRTAPQNFLNLDPYMK